jgi:hypothetical protein
VSRCLVTVLGGGRLLQGASCGSKEVRNSSHHAERHGRKHVSASGCSVAFPMELCHTSLGKNGIQPAGVYNSPALARQAAAIIGKNVKWCPSVRVHRSGPLSIARMKACSPRRGFQLLFSSQSASAWWPLRSLAPCCNGSHLRRRHVPSSGKVDRAFGPQDRYGYV